MKIETLAVHAGRNVDPNTKAVTPPIYLSTTFERQSDGEYPKGYNYSRNNNPNRESLEKCLAKLEGGSEGIAFSSGSAAAMSIFLNLYPGDHVIATDDIYHGTRKLFINFEKWNITCSFVNMTKVEEVEKAINNKTKLFWIESPTNPLLKIIDIEKISKIAHKTNAVVVCDNTWGTPILQNPFEFGADLIVHATTKYIGGHSDILGGIVISKKADELYQKIRDTQKSGGAVPSPFECWLVLRGIQTLPLRVRTQSDSALKIAQFLSSHDNVETVHYPGLETHPGHLVAKKQMKMFGGMISFRVKGEEEEAMKVAAKVKLFTRATSLGGSESLIEHRASIEGPESKTPNNLLRLSIGLEHHEDLIADLAQALDQNSI
jgi:cystathionine gamma-synthase